MSSFETPYSRLEIYSFVPVSMEDAFAVGTGNPPGGAAEYMSCCHADSGAWDRRSSEKPTDGSIGSEGNTDPAAGGKSTSIPSQQSRGRIGLLLGWGSGGKDQGRSHGPVHGLHR